MLYTTRPFFTLLIGFFLLISAISPLTAETLLRIHLISGSTEYESEPSLRRLKQMLEQDYNGITVTASWGKDRGNDLPNVSELAEADLVIIFTRRMELPEEQLDFIRAHFAAEKPAIGIRTASHAFQAFLEMDQTVFGGSYSGHGPDEPVAVSIAPNAEDHPVLKNVNPWNRFGKLYYNRTLASTATPLLYGTGENTDLHEPLAWTNRYGNSGRAFYTSMGFPHDFENPNFRNLLFNAIQWTTGQSLQKAQPETGR